MLFRPSFVRTALPALFLLFVSQAVAQDPKPKVVLYKDRLAAQFDTVDCVKNVFKINPLLFFRGEIPLYYERALTPKLSLELGVGFTYRNYLALSFVGDDADDFGAGTKIIARPSFHIAARFYLQDDLEPQGFYLQPEFAHLRYSKDISTKMDTTGVFTGESLLDDRTYNDLRFLAGYQMLSGSSNWMVDFYGGLALRSRNMVVVKENHDVTAETYTYTVTETTDAIPAIFLGVKFGLGF